VRMTTNGTEVLNGSLAVNDPFKQDHTDFVDVTAFGKLAINTKQYSGKGKQVLVDGKLHHERWETEDGQKRSRHLVRANRIVFLESRNSSGNTNSSNQQSYQQNNQQYQQSQPQAQQPNPFEQQGQAINIQDDDLPF